MEPSDMAICKEFMGNGIQGMKLVLAKKKWRIIHVHSTQ